MAETLAHSTNFRKYITLFLLHKLPQPCNSWRMSEMQTEVMVPEWDLADRMRKALRISGMDVQEMADYLGVARNTVSTWINGRNRPSRPTLRLWAIRCGVPYEWLLEEGLMFDNTRGADGDDGELLGLCAGCADRSMHCDGTIDDCCCACSWFPHGEPSPTNDLCRCGLGLAADAYGDDPYVSWACEDGAHNRCIVTDCTCACHGAGDDDDQPADLCRSGLGLAA
jgi:Helix-turn-helix